MRSNSTALLVLTIGLAGVGPGAAGSASADTAKIKVSVLASDRARYESVAWFRSPAGGGGAVEGSENYGFGANQLRAGVRAALPNAQFLVEMQDTRLLGLPTDASLTAPYGNLGPGAVYYFHSRTGFPSETFVRQAVLTVKALGGNAAIGRFELGEGMESVPVDADLLWIKRARIAERMVGSFAYTHSGRTADGLKLWVDRPAWNTTLFGVKPTSGGFALEDGKELSDVEVLGASVSARKAFAPEAGDARAFWIHYRDERVQDGVPVRVDNRPLAVRQADLAVIDLDTWGAHAAAVANAGAGRIDGLVWGAYQTGAWGAQTHRAWAGALEVGYKWPRAPLAPWLRAGINVGSGDGDPSDARHETFAQLLPTARAYALLPFYNAMNLDDRFVQVIARLHPKVLLRVDYHALQLNSSWDLWYGGGGAGRQDVFGFAGTPSGGQRTLAQVFDVSVTANPHKRVTLHGYAGRAFGDDVVKATFAGSNATFGYLEATLRY